MSVTGGLFPCKAVAWAAGAGRRGTEERIADLAKLDLDFGFKVDLLWLWALGGLSSKSPLLFSAGLISRGTLDIRVSGFGARSNHQTRCYRQSSGLVVELIIVQGLPWTKFERHLLTEGFSKRLDGT